MKEFIRDNKTFTVLLALAIIIRFIPFFDYQYSYDELCGLRNSLYPNWRQMIDYGVKLDTHPILVQLIIDTTVKIFGYSECWVKLPFLLFSIAAIIYAYLFAKKWFGETSAIITTVIFSFSYIFLFYAPLARMYAGGLFFSTALMYYLFEICFTDSRSLKKYFLFVLFVLLCALNNHLSALFAFTAAVAGLLFQKKETIVYYLTACIAAVVFYLPHLNITMWQFAQGGIGHRQDGWLPAPDKWALFSFLKTLLGTGYLWILFAGLFVAALFYKKRNVNSKMQIVLLSLFLINYTIIYGYSITKAPIFQNSVMLFSAPCFVWFFTSFFEFKNTFAKIITGIISCVLLFQSFYVKDLLNNAVLNQNAYQSEQFVKWEEKAGKGKVEAYYLGSQRYFVIAYELKYNKKFNYCIGEDFPDYGAFYNRVRKSDSDYILLGECDVIQLEIVKQFFPVLVESKQTLNVNYYCFSKNKTSIENGSLTDLIASYNPNKPGEFEFNFNKDKMEPAGNLFTYTVDSLNEFCFTAKIPLGNLKLKEGNVLLAKIETEADTVLNNVGLHFSINNNKDSSMYFGGSDLQWFYDSYSKTNKSYAQLFVGSELKNWRKQEGTVGCFVWNRGKKQFKVKSFEIFLINYWPKRWSWWD